ncbi:MAG: hypothetical protein WBW41_14830 [Verrucomicrobiia bacterium]
MNTNIATYQVETTSIPWTPWRLITVLGLICAIVVIVKVVKSGKKK